MTPEEAVVELYRWMARCPDGRRTFQVSNTEIDNKGCYVELWDSPFGEPEKPQYFSKWFPRAIVEAGEWAKGQP